MSLNHAELGAILAGLRLLQAATNVPADIVAIQSDVGQTKPLDADGIDALCERLNAPTPVLPDEDTLANFMRRRIKDGEWDLENDIPVRLARFGLMDPADFAAEMQERVAMRKAEEDEDKA